MKFKHITTFVFVTATLLFGSIPTFGTPKVPPMHLVTATCRAYYTTQGGITQRPTLICKHQIVCTIDNWWASHYSSAGPLELFTKTGSTWSSTGITPVTVSGNTLVFNVSFSTTIDVILVAGTTYNSFSTS